jgi:CheY-like chemotaxis protein
MSKLIFLIDDDEDEMEIFKEAIARAGACFKFLYMNSVIKALDTLENLCPDSIFIDMNMPGIDGLKGISILRTIEKLKAIPIVMYSNGMSDKLCAEALSTGASFCLKKTASIKDLSNFLKKHFNELPVTPESSR